MAPTHREVRGWKRGNWGSMMTWQISFKVQILQSTLLLLFSRGAREGENKREFWDFYCCFGQRRSDQYVKTLSLSTSANSWAWLAGTHPPTAVSLCILTPFTLSEDNGGEQRIRKAINRGKQEVMIRWKPTGRVCGNKIELLLQFFGRACAPILSRVKILPVPAAGRIATVRWLIEANPGVGVKRLRPC